MKISPRRSNLKHLLQSNWLVSSLLTFGLLTGCTTPSTQQPGDPTSPTASEAPAATPDSKPKVVATNTVLCDLTKQIAASTVDVVCLLAAGSDAHVYKLTPEARQSIEDAKLVLYGGYNFEPELIKAIKATSNPAPKIAVHEVAVPQPQKFEEDGKSTTDPHVWHNAQNGIEIAKTIEANLEKLVPAQAAIYKQNTQKLTGELGQLDSWMKSQIGTIPAAKKMLISNTKSIVEGLGGKFTPFAAK